ncbi:MAG: cohesin domain-containing protein [Verrucomicrobiia bacterium]
MQINEGDIIAANYTGNSVLRIDPVSGNQVNLGTFASPTDVVVGDGATIYVAEWAGAVRRIDLKTGLVDTVNPSGGISQLWGITQAPGGDLYVTSRANNGIYRMVPSTGETTLLTELAAGSTLIGIDVLDSSHLVVSSWVTSELISVALTDGAQSAITANAVDHPWGVAVRGSDLFVAAYDQKVLQRVSAGVVSTIAATEGFAYGIDLHPDGNIVASSSGVGNEVVRVSPSGQLLNSFSGGGIGWITGLDIAPYSVTPNVTISGAVCYYTGTQMVPDVILTLNGDSSGNASSASDGSYLFAVSPGGDYTVTPSRTETTTPSTGVNTRDITLLRRHILAIEGLDSPYKLLAADVDGLGSVNTRDITLVRRLILGITNNLPVGLWTLVPSDYVFPDPTQPSAFDFPTNCSYPNIQANVAAEDYTAIKNGDVDGGWAGSAAVPLGLAANQRRTTLAEHQDAPHTVVVTVGQQVLQPGELTTVPISVSGFQKVSGLQFTLGWDPGLLDLVAVTNTGLPGLTTEHFNDQLNGKLAVAWDDESGLGISTNDGFAIFAIQFRAIGGTGSVAELAFEEIPTPPGFFTEYADTAVDWRNGKVTIVSGVQPRDLRLQQHQPLVRLVFRGAAGLDYRIQSCESLSHPEWQTLGTSRADAEGVGEYTASPPVGRPATFYRVVYP